MRDRARDVFVALTGVETGSTTLEAFEDVFNNDFSAWRVFFRAVKDLTADNESALAELSGGGFLVGMFNTPRAGTIDDRSFRVVLATARLSVRVRRISGRHQPDALRTTVVTRRWLAAVVTSFASGKE